MGGADLLGGFGVGAALGSEGVLVEVVVLVEVGFVEVGAFIPLLLRVGLGLLAAIDPFATEFNAADLGCLVRVFVLEDGVRSFD